MENADELEFEDLGTRRKAAVTKLTKTVLNHTAPFVQQFTANRKRSLSELSEDDIDPSLLGKFADYILKNTKVVKFNSHDSYISRFKKILEEKFPDIVKNWNIGDYHSNLRRSIFDIHTDVSSNTGVPLAEHTKEMTVPEFKYIMIQSYKLGLTEFRAFCGLDESMAGRVNEAINVHWTVLNVHPEFYNLQSRWFRGKTKTAEDVLNIFPCLDGFEWCAIHSLATLAALRTNIDLCIFPNLGTSKASSSTKAATSCQKVNQTLKEFEKTYANDTSSDKPLIYQSNLTSHSIRALSCNILDKNDAIKDSWADRRVAHTNQETLGKHKDTKRAYVQLNDSTDVPCGKALAFHPYISEYNSTNSIKCIYINALPNCEHEQLTNFAVHLFHSITHVELSVRIKMCCILVTWYNIAKQKYPQHQLQTTMETVAQEKCQIQVCKLQEWSNILYDYLNRSFSVSTPLLSVSEGGTPLELIQKVIQTLSNLDNQYKDLRDSQLAQNVINETILSKITATDNRNIHLLESLNGIITNLSNLNIQNRQRRTVQTSIALAYSNTSNSMSGTNNTNNDNTISNSASTSTTLPTTNATRHSFPKRYGFTDIKSVVYNFYVHKLYNISADILSREDKSELHKSIKMITICKSFIPSNCTLLSHPMPVETTAFTVWQNKFLAMCNDIQTSLMSFLRDYMRELGKELTSTEMKKASYDSTYKKLTQVPHDRFQPILVTDIFFTAETSKFRYYASVNWSVASRTNE